MADTVSVQTIADTVGVKHVVKMTNFSDGSGESLVKKIDASATTFMSEDGNKKLAQIWWSVNTTNPKSCVELLWDGSTNASMGFFGGSGYINLYDTGNMSQNNATDPTGDVLLSTRNFAVGDNYTIIAEFR